MINVVVITGRLTRDVELRSLDSGANVANFGVAVERNYVSRDTNERQADFFNVVAWRGTADFVAKYFKKGDMIAIDGSLQSRQYTDKDGNNRTAIDIVADNISFCGGKNSGAGSSGVHNSNDNVTADSVVDDGADDLPF